MQRNEKQGLRCTPRCCRAAAPATAPKLFHKGELSTDGNLSAEVRAALAARRRRWSGVVYNAVDDHLDGPEQLQLRWTLEELRLLPAAVARGARLSPRRHRHRGPRPRAGGRQRARWKAAPARAGATGHRRP
ncbi:MAG: hypothetical protein MZW92_66070 [Comamonadaceae bacterium]|nr:hypothetical protein [Comamonadaceae bacterium]